MPKLPSVCVVGAGGWGKNHVRTFSRLKSCTLAAIADSRPGIQQSMREQYPHVRVTDSYDEILEDTTIDAVILATPAPLHADMAESALRAGKHVFVEKPFTLTVEEADRVLAAKPVDKVLMVGHLLLFHTVVARLKQLIESGELGDIRYIYTQRLNLGVIRKDENVWWSLAPHDISIVLYLLGEEPDRIVATGACYLQPDVEDVVIASLKFPSGRMANIHVSWLDPHKERKVVVVGSKKMAVFDDMEPVEKLRIFDKGADINSDYQNYSEWITIRSGDIVIPSIRLTEPLAIECQHFIDCITNGSIPVTDGQSARGVVSIMEQVTNALKSSRTPVHSP